MEQYQSQDIDQLVGALVKAQLAMVPASKDHVNPFFKSKYADLPSCWEATACFREQGIAITQSPMEGPDGYVLLDTQLSHVSGQWMRSRLKIRIAKDDPQGYGSAITYARRYALGCMTGLTTEEDDDGNAASHQPTRTVTQHKQTAQAKLNELRSEGAAAESSRSAPATPAPAAGTLTPVQDLTISGWGTLLGSMENDPDLADLLTMVKEQCGLKSLAYPKVSPKDRIEFLTALKQSAQANGLSPRVTALGL